MKVRSLPIFFIYLMTSGISKRRFCMEGWGIW